MADIGYTEGSGNEARECNCFGCIDEQKTNVWTTLGYDKKIMAVLSVPTNMSA